MRAETDYWSLTARFIKSASGSKYVRKGKLNLSFILFLSLSFVCLFFISFAIKIDVKILNIVVVVVVVVDCLRSTGCFSL